MESLFLNKIKINTFGIPITRIIQIGDISSGVDLKSSFSYTIKIPNTSNTKKVLEMLGVSGNTSRKPYEGIIADYIIDEIPIVVNGSAIIRESDGYYSINIIDGIRSLTSLLSNKYLSDLDLSDLEHYLTPINYINSLSNTEGYIYGFARYGIDTNLNVKIEDTAPSIYINTIFKKIIEGAGFTLIGDFFTTNAEYLKEVLVPSKGFTIDEFVLTDTPKGGCDTNLLAESDSSSNPIYSEINFTLTDVDLIDITVNGIYLNFTVAGDYEITINNTYNVTSGNIIEAVYKNGIEIATQGISGAGTSTKIVNTSIITGDQLTFKIRATGVYNSIPEKYEYEYTISAGISVKLKENPRLIKPIEYIAKIKQINFIKDIINRYGLVIKPIDDNKQFEFKQIDNILNDFESAEDWTGKLSKKLPETYHPKYAQKNTAEFIYANELDAGTQDGEMNIDNVNLINERPLFKSIFEIPKKLFSIEGVFLYDVPIWEIVNEIKENKISPPKIMKIQRVDATINATLFDSYLESQTGNVPYLSINNLSLQFSLDNYYFNFQKLIENYKEVPFLFNLSNIDIYNLDFFKLKYLKTEGRYYYLKNVQHTNKELSKVKFIEIP